MLDWLPILGFIPSPTRNSFTLTIHAYGIIIACGTLLAIYWLSKRWAKHGYDPEDIMEPIFYGIIAGFLGARFTYIVPRFFDPTADGLDFYEYLAQPWRFFAIWEGGIAILGGLTAGGFMVMWMLRRRQLDMPVFWDCAAPVLPLAQGIGRWGNFFNQELYGGPLDGVPWKLYIDPAHRRPGLEQFEYFHPTFLYEFLWNMTTVGLIVWLDRKRLLPRGALIFVFGASYGTIRLILEQLRTDEIIRYYGLSRNSYMAICFIVFSVAMLVGLTLKERKAQAVQTP